MQVILIAAGRSTRMNPVKDKNFLKFVGKTLIQHQIDLLKSVDLTDIIVVGGEHNLERLSEIHGIKTVEQKNLDEGMAGAVLAGEGMIDEQSPILIFSSNDIIDKRAFELILDENDSPKNSEISSFILGKKVKSYFPGGYLETDSDNLIKGIVEKPGEGNEPSDLINLVVHIHNHPAELFQTLENIDSDKDDRYEVALDSLIQAGSKFKAVSYDGAWQPIKFPWHVNKAALYFISNKLEGKTSLISDSAQIADSAKIGEGVIIDDGVKVFDNAVINGPCYIGKNSVVANNALVRESHIGDGCVVGFSTEIARSYVGDKTWFHSNYIGDSIIGDNCSFGAGCVTGNLRFDEGGISVNIKDQKINSGENKLGTIMGSNIRTGVNTSIMPGVKIGSNSLLGAGIVISKDVQEGKYLYGNFELKEADNKLDITERDNF